MGTDPHVKVEMMLSQRVRGGAPAADLWPGSASDQEAGLLVCQGWLDAAEAVAQHLVHRRGHVLEAATEQHRHVGGAMGGGELGDLTKPVQALGKLADHDGGPGEQFPGQWELAEPVNQPGCHGALGSHGPGCANGVERQCLLAGDEVLVDPNLARTVQRYGAERHGPIAVSDHDDLARRRGLQGCAGLCKDQPVGAVDGHKVVGLQIGETPQGLEPEGIAGRRRLLSQGGEHLSGRELDPEVSGQPGRSSRSGRGCSSQRGS